MNYIGSKLKLSYFIKSTIKSVVGYDMSDKIFCDLFAGTGIIGRVFKLEVKKVIANDFEYYSYVLNKNYIENHTEIHNKLSLLDDLNRLEVIDTGFIYNNYCLGGGSGRQYFSDYNGKKIDTIRLQIEKWYSTSVISSNLYFFLLTSLLEGADKVANTASVYGAYLKDLKRTAQNKLVLLPALYDFNQNKHEVYNMDSNELISLIEGDILYMDPPYNARQYGANYHLLNTIAKYSHFTPKGKTGMPEYKKSLYCSSISVAKAFEDIIKNAHFKYIFLSYNNEGLMSVDDVKRIMQKYGRYDISEVNYHRFKADKTENRIHKADVTKEYLHILEKK